VTGWINSGLAGAGDSKLIFLTRKPPHKIRQRGAGKQHLFGAHQKDPTGLLIGCDISHFWGGANPEIRLA
jgi:hypothetical protein